MMQGLHLTQQSASNSGRRTLKKAKKHETSWRDFFCAVILCGRPLIRRIRLRNLTQHSHQLIMIDDSTP